VKGNPSLALARLDLGIAEEELGTKTRFARFECRERLDPRICECLLAVGARPSVDGKDVEAKKGIGSGAERTRRGLKVC